jgi:predicted helicase
MTERLGIVYTPVEVVDFIIHSVNDLLQSEFGATLGDKGVHIIDPFTGTGTFITRLLQSGLITPEQLPHKYRNEIHANELVLLAYYIAAINIEAVYHSLVGGEYVPFEGICLTDTFQMYEKDDLVNALLVDNSARRQRQKKLDIQVIFGNPPYSVGQDSANDNNANVNYPHLDGRIRRTYAERSTATLKNALYDSYIRSIRWASDRIGESGIVGFVTNAGFLEANTADGLRKCLADEFSSIYVFHLRGNQRTSGETSRREGGKIFGSGSRAPIAISLLIKNPKASQYGRIHFHDIGEYLSREEKLHKISLFASVAGITTAQAWQALTPNEHGDWLNQRDESFSEHIVLGAKKSAGAKLFDNFSSGVKTNRDAWCYNASRVAVDRNMAETIEFYNSEVERFELAFLGLDRTTRESNVRSFINTDAKKMSWDHAQQVGVERGRRGTHHTSNLARSLYRPFTKQWLYFDGFFNNRVYQMPRIFPVAGLENRVITINAKHSGDGQLALISDTLPDLHSNGDAQCFPLYLYEAMEADSIENDTERPCSQKRQPPLFTEGDDVLVETAPAESDRLNTRRYEKKEAVTEEGFAHFLAAYPCEHISKEDVFYYVYGLLHSPDYLERYADNLSKELPRIPCVKTAADFWDFSQAGRKLADLHINYEKVTPYPAQVEGDNGNLPSTQYRVEKMKYGRVGKDKDLSTIHYNAKITVRAIPLEAYEYVVNGKSAIDWVMERQCVKTDKDSGIVNDANEWAVETMGNPRYPLELLLRVITVSVETVKIVKGLPPLVI